MKIFFIFLLSLSLRLYGLDWDQGHHLHPDERMISMVIDRIEFPQISSDPATIFSPQSALNPKFFAYGSFPLYFLKLVTSVLPSSSSYSQYQSANLLGRGISAIFDSLSVVLIFKIGQLIFNPSVAILASIIYALAVFPIQLSHFYAVDTILNFFILFTLYHLLDLYLHRRLKSAILVGFGFGLSLATKISATVLVVSIGFTFLLEFLLYFFKKYQKPSPALFKRNSLLLLLIFLITFVTFFISQPFAFFDFPTFWQQIDEQRAMTKDAFVFPYTLQYVFTPPYLYHLKNIFFWGLGPLTALFAFVGFFTTFITLIKNLFKPGNDNREGLLLIVYIFFLTYFGTVGSFAVKFMRYCLPIYPFLSLFAAKQLSSFSKKIFFPIFFILHFGWLLAFANIYSHPNTRVEASHWINQNIPPGSLILREHWDDGLPIFSQNQYQFEDLTLYDSDTDPQKWPKINSQLSRADYLIIASNRLYTPLSRLTNCQILPPGKCYQKTANYYQKLFSNQLDYQLVAEFEQSPTIFGLKIDDQSADESFTVYDHPKILIFKNVAKN